MTELAKIVGLGAAAATITLLFAPPGVVYLAAFIVLVPMFGIGLRFALRSLGGRLRDFLEAVESVSRLMAKASPQSPKFSPDRGAGADLGFAVERSSAVPSPNAEKQDRVSIDQGRE